eukprot:m.32214 g.32214  ORF g.32214 m.32214 type:complete len:436 (-) comp8386_c0_seq1:184-1491(-)
MEDNLSDTMLAGEELKRKLLASKEDPTIFLDLICDSFDNQRRSPSPGFVSTHPVKHVSTIKYFGKPILPCKITPQEREEMRDLRAEAVYREGLRKKMQPRFQSTHRPQTANKSVHFAINEPKYPDSVTRKISLPVDDPSRSTSPLRTNTRYPPHRSPDLQNRNIDHSLRDTTNTSGLVTKPPQDLYPPIQLVTQPQVDKQQTKHNISKPAHSPRRVHDLNLTEEDVMPGLIAFVSLVKGYIVRQLMHAEKVRLLVRTIKDTQRIVNDFNREAKGSLSPNDEVFLEQAQSQLNRARNRLLHIFRTPTERAKHLRLMRQQQQELVFRPSSEPNISGSDTKLSAATRRSIQRKKDNSKFSAKGLKDANSPGRPTSKHASSGLSVTEIESPKLEKAASPQAVRSYIGAADPGSPKRIGSKIPMPMHKITPFVPPQSSGK